MNQPDPARVLVLFAHPALHTSRVNRALLQAARQVRGITVHDLYEAYPAHDLDVPREQTLLTAHDVVVLQHPFYWYSVPPILKEWMDLVLEHGWAYGSKGTALRGKTLISAITTGGRESAYSPGGGNRYTMLQFLAPVEMTARLCGMNWLPPFVAHGTHRMTADDIRRHAADYRRLLEALRDGTVDAGRADEYERINVDLESVIGTLGSDGDAGGRR